MKLRNFLACAMASVVALAACEREANLGAPSIALSVSEVTFDKELGDTVITLTSTRDWTVTLDEETAKWLVVSPDKGEASADAQEVTLSVLSNSGFSREASVPFSIGMQTKYLTVKQDGPKGSADALVVYGNNFDKTKAEKGDRWSTYLDTFDGWRNETGTGIASVSYASKSLTARTNSGNGSGGKYSDYVELGASGMNYLWFGTAPTYFAVKNITLPEGYADYTLLFGTERYEYSDGKTIDNTFNWNEFSVYISADAKKWVKLSCDFAGGSLPNGRWDLASSTFTLPAETTSLSLYFTSTYGSAYAMDDLKLVQSATAGTSIDFTTGVEIEVGDNSGDSSGGNTEVTPPATPAEAVFFESFAESKGDFTIDNKALPSELEYVWNHAVFYEKAYMKASAYKDDKKFASESWLISPEIDLTSLATAYLSFEHTGKHFGTMSNEATVWATKDGSTWTQLTIPTYMGGNDWEFVFSGNIDLKDYVGGKMKFAFKYVSTTNAAPTWEIKNVTVSSAEVSEGGNAGGNTGDVESGNGDYDASIVFAEAGYSNSQSVDGVEIKIGDSVTAVFAKGSANNPPAYYDSGQAIRMYQNGATLDITAVGKTITEIRFTFANNQYYIGADKGELSGENAIRVWKGRESAVKFTATGTDKNHRAYVTKIEVAYE